MTDSTATNVQKISSDISEALLLEKESQYALSHGNAEATLNLHWAAVAKAKAAEAEGLHDNAKMQNAVMDNFKNLDSSAQGGENMTSADGKATALGDIDALARNQLSEVQTKRLANTQQVTNKHDSIEVAVEVGKEARSGLTVRERNDGKHDAKDIVAKFGNDAIAEVDRKINTPQDAAPPERVLTKKEDRLANLVKDVTLIVSGGQSVTMEDVGAKLGGGGPQFTKGTVR